MALKLYKTVFWISFATLIGTSFWATNSVYVNFKNAEYRASNDPYAPITHEEMTTFIEPNRAKPFFEYRGFDLNRDKEFECLVAALAQFFILISLKKWITWVAKPLN